jgi:hypothetical protein
MTEEELRADQFERTRPVLADDDRWKKEAVDARHTGLATVQSKAESWGKSIEAILGAFAIVAFIKGPEALGDLPTGPKVTYFLGVKGVPFVGDVGRLIDPARSVVLLIFLASAMVIVAVALAAIASQGVPTWTRILGAQNLRDNAVAATKRAIRYLQFSRILTLGAALLVFAALAIAWTAVLDNPDEPKAQEAIVSSADGTLCGALQAGPDGTLNIVPKGAGSTPVSASSQITLVESCPAASTAP